MQLRKMVVMLTALGAMSLMMTGCDGDTATAGLCTDDTSCTGNEICHPTAKVCVSTCTTSADCPANAKTCAAVAGASQSVCQCETTQLCNLDRDTADQVCSTLDKVCTTACSADTDCPTGRTCDTATGQCGAATNTDPCKGQCTATETCDTTGTTPTCRPPSTVGNSCQGTAQSTCSYGEYCGSASTCTLPPAPTCGNLAGKPAANFTPATGTGNIIYNVVKRTFETDTAGCPGTTNPVKAIPRIFFYTKEGTLPATEEGLQGFFYVRTDKGEIPLNAANLLNYTRSADGKSATIDAFLCTPNVNEIILAFYFTGGNGYCATFTR